MCVWSESLTTINQAPAAFITCATYPNFFVPATRRAVLALALSAHSECNRKPPLHHGRKAMALGVRWSCLDTRQRRRCVCWAPVGNSCSRPPQVQEELSTSFYKICNYYGRQGCGFKPSQYVDKHYTHTHTLSHTQLPGKWCCCMRHNKAGCQNAVQVGRKPSGPVEEEPDGRNEACRKVPGKL